MESSLSSVPPVWPRPRPEIIGTYAPQAASIGASISETLSPTPPVECLSRIGPGRLSSRQSRLAPERVMARVSATRSSSVIPRKKTAMAKAAAWPSVTAPLVRPAMKSPISPALNGSPSRLARMISCGRIIADLGASAPTTVLRTVPLPRRCAAWEDRKRRPEPLAHPPTQSGGGEPPWRGRGAKRSCAPWLVLADESAQEALEAVGGLAGDGLRLLMARVAAGETGGIIGDDRDGGAAQARAPGQDHLRHGRHADEIGAEDPGGANLGRRLEARAGEPHVDTLVQLDVGRSRRFAQRGQQRFVVGSGQRHETVMTDVADERIGAGEVDVIGDRDQRRRRPFLVEAAGGVGEQQRFAAELAKRLDRRAHGAR